MASWFLPNPGFYAILWDILRDSVPFLLAGAIISSLIEAYLREDKMTQMLPRTVFPGILVAGFMGMIIPICECGSVLVVRRLVKKGLPLYLGTVFMLAAPIVNPVVITSTKIAFTDYPPMLFLRIVGGFTVALLVGLILKWQRWENHESIRGEKVCSAGCCSSHTLQGTAKFRTIGSHAAAEFMTMGKYFMLGAFIAAYVQSVIPADALANIGVHSRQSTVFMMGMAYLLSICSEADAFVASTFLATFTTGSVLTFLIYGPMIDLKNTFVLLGAFSFKYVASLIFTVTVLVYAVAVFVNMFF